MDLHGGDFVQFVEQKHLPPCESFVPDAIRDAVRGTQHSDILTVFCLAFARIPPPVQSGDV